MAEDLRMELKKVEWELEEIDKALTVIYNQIEACKLPRAFFVVVYWTTFILGLALTWWSLFRPESAVSMETIAATLAVCAMAICSATCTVTYEKGLKKYQERLDEIKKRLDRLAKKVEDDD